MYALTLEGGTPLFRLYSGDLDAIDDNVWIIAADHLEVLGYRRYEVSNFALPGCQSRHNIRYWKLKPYIGTGAGGVSTLHTGDGDLFRIANVPSLERYLASDGLLCGAETEEVAGKSYIFEYLMMGLRMIQSPKLYQNGKPEVLPWRQKILLSFPGRGFCSLINSSWMHFPSLSSGASSL